MNQRLLLLAVALGLVVLAARAEEKTGSSYRFRGGEEISVSVIGEGQQPIRQVVSGDGLISLPAGGTVNVMGKTLAEAIAMVAGKIESSYGLIDPQVSVAIHSLPKSRAYIQGEVSRPQAIDLPTDRPLYLAAALAVAGGVTQDADYSQIKLIRTGDAGKESVHIVDGTQFTARGSSYRGPELLEGDLIVVPRAEFFAVTGKVEKPGIYGRKDTGVPPGTPVRLSQAIAAAGGPKAIADSHRVRLIRTDLRGQRKVVEVDLDAALDKGDLRHDPVLEDGDQIVIPGSDGIMIFGQVKSPGVYYPFGGPMTVARIISQAGGFTEDAQKKQVLVHRKDSKGAPVTVDMKAFTEGGDASQNFVLNPGDIVFVKGGF